MPSLSIDDGHRLGDVVVVVQRLAHAHQHDGGEQPRRLALRARPFAVGVARRHELADDLRRRRGCAPGAACRCGRSGRTACSRPARRCRRRRDPPRGRGCRRSPPPGRRGSGTGICGSRPSLVCTVAASGRPMTKRSASFACSGRAIVRHAGEVGDALVVDPVPELLGAERRLADRRQLGGQFVARQADQVAPPVGSCDRRRIEQRRLGQDAVALGRRQVAVGSRGHLAGHALLIAA